MPSKKNTRKTGASLQTSSNRGSDTVGVGKSVNIEEAYENTFDTANNSAAPITVSKNDKKLTATISMGGPERNNSMDQHEQQMAPPNRTHSNASELRHKFLKPGMPEIDTEQWDITNSNEFEDNGNIFDDSEENENTNTHNSAPPARIDSSDFVYPSTNPEDMRESSQNSKENFGTCFDSFGGDKSDDTIGQQFQSVIEDGGSFSPSRSRLQAPTSPSSKLKALGQTGSGSFNLPSPEGLGEIEFDFDTSYVLDTKNLAHDSPKRSLQPPTAHPINTTGGVTKSNLPFTSCYNDENSTIGMQTTDPGTNSDAKSSSFKSNNTDGQTTDSPTSPRAKGLLAKTVEKVQALGRIRRPKVLPPKIHHSNNSFESVGEMDTFAIREVMNSEKRVIEQQLEKKSKELEELYADVAKLIELEKIERNNKTSKLLSRFFQNRNQVITKNENSKKLKALLGKLAHKSDLFKKQQITERAQNGKVKLASTAPDNIGTSAATSNGAKTSEVIDGANDNRPTNASLLSKENNPNRASSPSQNNRNTNQSANRATLSPQTAAKTNSSNTALPAPHQQNTGFVINNGKNSSQSALSTDHPAKDSTSSNRNLQSTNSFATSNVSSSSRDGSSAAQGKNSTLGEKLASFSSFRNTKSELPENATNNKLHTQQSSSSTIPPQGDGDKHLPDPNSHVFNDGKHLTKRYCPGEWMNKIIEIMWPFINIGVRDYLAENLAPMINWYIPPPFNKVKFENSDLGTRSMNFGPFNVFQKSKDILQMDVGLRWESKVRVLDLSLLGASLGIDSVLIDGTLSIHMPLLKEVPILGGCQIFMINQPKVELGFSGVTSLIDTFPLVVNAIRTIVAEAVSGLIVLPNATFIPFVDYMHFAKVVQTLSKEAQQTATDTDGKSFSKLTSNIFDTQKSPRNSSQSNNPNEKNSSNMPSISEKDTTIGGIGNRNTTADPTRKSQQNDGQTDLEFITSKKAELDNAKHEQKSLLQKVGTLAVDIATKNPLAKHVLTPILGTVMDQVSGKAQREAEFKKQLEKQKRLHNERVKSWLMTKLQFPTPEKIIRIHVKRARGLKGMDWKLFKENTSDPYCTIKIGGRMHRTKTVSDTVTPVWCPDEFYDFFLFDWKQTMSVEVFDEDMGVVGRALFGEGQSSLDDDLGKSDVFLSDFISMKDRDVTKWLTLYERNSLGQRQEACGEIELRLQLFNLRPCRNVDDYRLFLEAIKNKRTENTEELELMEKGIIKRKAIKHSLGGRLKQLGHKIAGTKKGKDGKRRKILTKIFGHKNKNNVGNETNRTTLMSVANGRKTHQLALPNKEDSRSTAIGRPSNPGEDENDNTDEQNLGVTFVDSDGEEVNEDEDIYEEYEPTKAEIRKAREDALANKNVAFLQANLNFVTFVPRQVFGDEELLLEEEMKLLHLDLEKKKERQRRKQRRIKRRTDRKFGLHAIQQHRKDRNSAQNNQDKDIDAHSETEANNSETDNESADERWQSAMIAMRNKKIKDSRRAIKRRIKDMKTKRKKWKEDINWNPYQKKFLYDCCTITMEIETREQESWYAWIKEDDGAIPGQEDPNKDKDDDEKKDGAPSPKAQNLDTYKSNLLDPENFDDEDFFEHSSSSSSDSDISNAGDHANQFLKLARHASKSYDEDDDEEAKKGKELLLMSMIPEEVDDSHSEKENNKNSSALQKNNSSPEHACLIDEDPTFEDALKESYNGSFL